MYDLFYTNSFSEIKIFFISTKWKSLMCFMGSNTLAQNISLVPISQNPPSYEMSSRLILISTVIVMNKK